VSWSLLAKERQCGSDFQYSIFKKEAAGQFPVFELQDILVFIDVMDELAGVTEGPISLQISNCSPTWM